MRDSEFHALLLDERQRVTHAVDYLQAEIHSPEEEASEEPCEGNTGGGATITLDREINITLEENSEHVLRAIDEALRCVGDGNFRQCIDCSRRIAIDRLRTMSYTTRCSECKWAEEKA